MKTVVVGGGIVGLAIAHELVAEGCEVTVVESGTMGAAASHGNAAKIAVAEAAPVPAPGVLLQGIRWMLKPDSPLAVSMSVAPEYVKFMLAMARHCNESDFRRGLEVHLKLAEDANDLLDAYVRDGIEFEMHNRGVLLAFETEDRFREYCSSLDSYEKFGIVPTRLRGDEIQAVEPALTERTRYGLHFTEDRQLAPDSLTRSLSSRLRERGARMLEHTVVDRLVRRGDRMSSVITDRGEEITADTVILAAGVGIRQLTKDLGLPLPVHPGKGYSLDYAPAPVDLRTSLTLEDARVAVTPLNGYVRLAGTMEFGRNHIHIDDVRVEAIRRAARESLREWPADSAGERTPWAGLRPMTPDGLPVVGRLGPLANTYVAGGHGMLGLTLAPGTAKIVSDQVLGRTPALGSEYLGAMTPNRFLRTRHFRAA